MSSGSSVVPVSSPQSADMTFTTNCLRASGIIRKQLVQLDTVMHPPASSITAPSSESQRSTTIATTTPRSANQILRSQLMCISLNYVMTYFCRLSFTAVSGVVQMPIISLHSSVTTETWIGSVYSTHSRTGLNSGVLA